MRNACIINIIVAIVIIIVIMMIVIINNIIIIVIMAALAVPRTYLPRRLSTMALGVR